MRNYYNFINENFYEASGYMKEININDLDAIIEKHCKDFSWSDQPIYRGFNSDNLFIADPSVIERKSANTQNYYTYIIDNSEEWKEYPDRGRSLICSMDYHTANSYSYATPHRVIPFDGAKFGITKKGDFWFSFSQLGSVFSGITMMDDFNTHLVSLGKIFKSEFLNINKKEFFSDLEIIFNRLRNITKEEIQEYIEIYNKDFKYPYNFGKYFIEDVLNTPKSLKEMKELLNPLKNKMKLEDYNILKKSENNVSEVWTDSKCLMVPKHIWEKYKKE